MSACYFTIELFCLSSIAAKSSRADDCLCDRSFYSRCGNPANVKVCPRNTWNERMTIETVFSLFTRVLHLLQLKKLAPRNWCIALGLAGKRAWLTLSPPTTCASLGQSTSTSHLPMPSPLSNNRTICY